MTLFVVFIAVLFALVLYRNVYLRPITSICVSPSGSCSLVSFKPNRKFMRSMRILGSVRLSDDIIALYSRPGSDQFKYRSFEFGDTVYLVRYARFKFCSVDLSDRAVSDVVSNFKFNSEVV